MNNHLLLFISRDINLYRLLFFQKLKTWVKCILEHLYFKFSKTAKTQKIFPLKVELEWIIMKSTKKPIPILLVEKGCWYRFGLTMNNNIHSLLRSYFSRCRVIYFIILYIYIFATRVYLYIHLGLTKGLTSVILGLTEICT